LAAETQSDLVVMQAAALATGSFLVEAMRIFRRCPHRKGTATIGVAIAAITDRNGAKASQGDIQTPSRMAAFARLSGLERALWLERFQAKRTPVRVRRMRQIKYLKRSSSRQCNKPRPTTPEKIR
jgi:hypothetical protein